MSTAARTQKSRGPWMSVLASLLIFAVVPASTLGADLSKYREFRFGTDLASVLKQTSLNSSQIKAIYVRPARIEELEWRPQSLAGASLTEATQDVTLSFFNGELFRIVVTYDRYQTDGMTTADMVDAISANYGTAATLTRSTQIAQGPFNDQEEVLARWQDTQYRFDLIHSAYGPGFRLIGVLIRLEAPAQAAILEAKRLDELEAPQRDATRIANEDEAAKAKLEKTRLLNKAKFRP